MSTIDVRVSKSGSIVGGVLEADPTMVAKCTLCGHEVESAAALGGQGYACANCLRERLDALSVARFRLKESRTSSLPWGKVTG